MRKGLWIGLGLAMSAAAMLSVRAAWHLAPLPIRGVVMVAEPPLRDAAAVTRVANPVNRAERFTTEAADPFAAAEPPAWDQVERAISIVRAEPRRTSVPAEEPPRLPQLDDPFFFDRAVNAPTWAGPTVSPEPIDGPVDALSVDPHPLRCELLAAVEQKLALMSVDQLRESLRTELATIRELEAAIQLAQAKEALETLSKSHPETEAAKAAKAMLSTPSGTHEQRDPFPAAPSFQPVRTRSTPARTFGSSH